MRTTKFLLLITLSILCLSEGNGQLQESYFSLTEDLAGGRVFDHLKSGSNIIVAGNSAVGSLIKPSVSKIDTLGNVIWSTVTNDQAAYTNSPENYVSKIFKSGSHIYALSRWYQWPITDIKIWKIDSSNGTIIWRKNFYATYKEPEHFIDFDNNRLLIGYYESWGSTNFAVLDKATGDTTSTHFIGDYSSNKFGLSVDSNKNIYYTYKDSIHKISGTNLDTTIWKNSLPSSSNIVDFLDIYIDANDSLFLFGRHDNSSATNGKGKIVKINSVTGSLLWETAVPTGKIQNVFFKDKDGYLHSTWRHANVGGGTYVLWTSKIQKTSGTLQWQNAFSFTGLGTPGPHSGYSEGPMSLDVDDTGDVYLTGYYGDANYGPEAWGIAKLNGLNGSEIYQLTITEDSTSYDNISVGMGACVINNTPYFLGNLETSHIFNFEKSQSTLIKLDGDSGKVIMKKYFGGSFQYPSKTVQIEKHLNGQTIILKQFGKHVRLDMLDFNENLLWSKTFTRNGKLLAGDLIVDPSGGIIFSAYTQQQKSTYPFFTDQTDSIYVFQLNALGTLNKEDRFYVGSFGSKPINLICDGNNAFIFYFKNNNCYFRKIHNNTISAEQNLSITYYSQEADKFVIDQGNSSLLVFGFKNSTNRVVAIDKATLNTTDMATIPLISKIYYATNYRKEVLLCGSDSANNDILISYNINSLDTSWTRSFSAQSKLYKLAFEEDSSHFYAIGTSSNQAIIRKIRTSDGRPKWLYTHNGSSNLQDQPLDIAYDKNRNQLLISGYESDSAGQRSVYVDLIDTSGTLIQKYVKKSLPYVDNSGSCCAILPNGAAWVGGSIKDSTYGLAGFIFEFDSLLYYQSVSNDTTCDSYISPSGNFTWSANGKYTDTITSGSGLDTLVIINLTVNKPDTSVQRSGYALKASDTAASYQWLDCNNLFAPLPGENNQQLSPKIDGNYAVQLTYNGCVDTSGCFVINGLGFTEDKDDIELNVFPNPTSGKLNLDFNQPYEQVEIIQMNPTGQILNKMILKPAERSVFCVEGSPGVYIINMQTSDGIIKRTRIVKQ